MKLCSRDCTPCCDFCKYAIHGYITLDNGSIVTSGPSGCELHRDEEHQDIAIRCGYCEDFYCFRADGDE